MSRMSVQMKGAERLLKLCQQADDAGMMQELRWSVTDVVNEVAAESQGLVPVDTGALKASMRVDRPEVSRSVVAVSISYGGPAAPYAEFVHENMNARHPRGGQAKFLETPVKRWQPKFVKAVKATFIARLRRVT